MNSLFVIKPYRKGAVWAFDDAERGLLAEPFVGDINLMIDRLCVMVDSNDITLIFSGKPFPGCQVELCRDVEEYGGHWYVCEEFKLRGWLCPALFKFFPEVPFSIYVQAEKD